MRRRGSSPAAICTEARELFEADVAQLWKVSDRRLEVIWREPSDALAPPGHVVEPRDYPGMQRSLERLDTTFFPDAREVVVGDALERVMAEGVRSVLRVPIVVGGRAEVLLALRWARIIPEPSPEMLALARRFADHAGLVIEQGERRRAEEVGQAARARAERLAGDLAQLHSLAMALGAASTASEAASLVAERVLAMTGAAEAAVFDVVDGRRRDLLASVSSDAALARGDDLAPGAPAVADEGEDDVPVLPTWPDESDSAAAVPFLVEGVPVGVLRIRFRPGHRPDDATRRLVETIAGQAAQPLERARLHESEHEARLQAEVSARRMRRLQALTAAFSGALTPAEVAATFLDETVGAVGAAAAALAVLDDEGRELQGVRSPEFPDELLGPNGTIPVESTGPAATAVRVQEAAYYDDVELLLARPSRASRARSRTQGSARSAFVPVTAGAAPLGVAVLAWRSRDARRRRRCVPRGGGGAVRPGARPRTLATRASGSVAETLQRSVLPETSPRWRACASPPCTCRARRRSTSAATGSTR